MEIKSGLAPTDVLRRIRLPNPVRRLEPLRHNSTLLNIRHIRQKNNALPDTHNWRSAPLTGTENDPNGRVWRVRDHAWERGITERCVLLAARHTPHKSHSGSPSERPSVGRGPNCEPVRSPCTINLLLEQWAVFLTRNDPVPKWRNWQTRMVQVHVPARVWGFESLLRHQSMVRAPRFLTLWGFALKAPRKSNLIPEAIPGRGHPVSADAGGTPNALRVGRRCTRCGNRPRCRARGRSWQQ